MSRIFITGAAGFIGFHLARRLLAAGHEVHGYDGMTDYYDPQLKRDRLARLEAAAGFAMTEGLLEDRDSLDAAVDGFAPEVIIHLAGQAGVRYSLENPRAYLDSNVTGSFNVLEAAHRTGVRHLMMASTSSVYGANTQMPFTETDKADTQMTIYAATKKATENIGHVCAHLWQLPVTMFRFFTVYGPWGRPDMAPILFASAITEGRPINVFNHGDMYRDFTYVEDLVEGIDRLMEAVPPAPERGLAPVPGDSLSPVAPFRVVNIGNADKVRLLDFIAALEQGLGRRAERNMMDMQPGDVPATWADVSLLRQLTGFSPKTDITTGTAAFAAWFLEYYGHGSAS